MKYREQIIFTMVATAPEIDSIVEQLAALDTVITVIEGDRKEIKETEPCQEPISSNS